MDPLAASWSRRTFLGSLGYGLGRLALRHLLGAPGADLPHHRPRVRRIVHLCMAGGPSQHESFDFKPELQRLHGQPFPESFTKGQQLAQLQNTRLLARGSFVRFARHGQSGQEISELFPHLARIADRLCIVRSLQTEQINHDPAHAFMNSGSIQKGRPSMGSWLLYGLGAETRDLPGFVVLTSAGAAGGAQPVSSRQWSAGFLPGRFQGIQLQARGDAVHYVRSPDGVRSDDQRAVIDAVTALDQELAGQVVDAEIETRIAAYEMAFRMQASVPELTDLASEPESVRRLYGVQRPGDGSFASNCLLARRLCERGVRFVQLYHRAWDHHGNLEKDMPVAAREVDQASAALVLDLERRGMLDDTLILWGGEFGRTPMGQGTGRDHHILGFSAWLCGGGVRGGITHGRTDDLGYRAVDGVVHVHDLHATLLHLCGIDHLRLTHRHQGRDYRLTDVGGTVVREILA